MNIDVTAELEPYLDKFERSKVIDGKLLSCSPFRQESHPSFVVWLDQGNWKDSGTGDKGSLAQLISYLSGDSVEDVVEMFRKEYGDISDVDSLELSLNLDLGFSEFITLGKRLPKEFMFRHQYLEGRGVSEKVQRAFKIGYSTSNQAVVIPWMDTKGNIVRYQFRSVNSKTFWFSKEGDRVKNHLFGLYHIHRKPYTTAWIVEAPIDAMYLWSNGIPAIATGTASISKEQMELLKKSPIETLVIATDNDEAGNTFKDYLVKELGGRMVLKDFEFPNGTKDVNDIESTILKSLCVTEMKYRFC